METRSTLCLQHRRALEADPRRAAHGWYQALHCARYEINAKQWHKAKRRYFHAVELAEILLLSDDNLRRRETRLLHTAIEYAYLLRALSLGRAGLVQYLRSCFINLECSKPVLELTQPIEDVNQASAKECAQWLGFIAQSFLAHGRTLH